MLSVTTRVKNRLDGVVGSLRKRSRAALKETVDEGVERCKQRSRVRTGTMRDGGNGYKGWHGEQISGNEWRISNDVPYTGYNEFGTHKMAAQPMLTPTMAEMGALVTDNLQEAWYASVQENRV